ncbi:MAG: hypothetical protein V1859_09330 [archaeon]
MMKRGEKSLSMIFGLFMLLIISLVVLSMFFKFVKQGGETTGNVAQSYAKEAAIDEAKAACAAMCEGIKDIATEIEFCSSMYKIDWDKDGRKEGTATYGQWWFCEEKIPCFVLVENCKSRYDGNRCRKDLAEYRPDLYIRFLNDIEGLSPDTNNNGVEPLPGSKETEIAFQDGCGLYYSRVDTTAVNPEGITTKYNWKERFCFNESIAGPTTPPTRNPASPAYICNAPI